jgi:hypothetical protein
LIKTYIPETCPEGTVIVPLLLGTNPAVPLNVKLTSAGFKVAPLRVSLFNTDVVVPPIPPV